MVALSVEDFRGLDVANKASFIMLTRQVMLELHTRGFSFSYLEIVQYIPVSRARKADKET
jgi:hypothetical protein